MKKLFLTFLSVLIGFFTFSQNWIDTLKIYRDNQDYNSLISSYHNHLTQNKIENDTIYLTAKMLLGEAFMQIEQTDSAIDIYKDILVAANKKNVQDKKLFFSLYNNIGRCYEFENEFYNAEGYYRSSYNFILENPNELYQYYKLAIANLSGVLITLEKYKEAKNLLDSALVINNRVFNETIKKSEDAYFRTTKSNINLIVDIYIHENLSKIYLKQFDYVNSENELKKCLVNAKEIKDYKLIKKWLNNLSDYYLDINETDSCERYINESLNLSLQNKDTLSVYFRYDDMGRLYGSSMRKFEKADSLCSIARNYFKWKHRIDDYIISSWRLGMIKINLKQYELGKEIFKETQDYCLNNNVKIDISDQNNLNEGIAICDFYLGNYDQAKRILKNILDSSQSDYSERQNTLSFYAATLSYLGLTKERDTVLSAYLSGEIIKMNYLMPTKSVNGKYQIIQSNRHVFNSIFSNYIPGTNESSQICKTGYDFILNTKSFLLYDEISLRKYLFNYPKEIQMLYEKYCILKKRNFIDGVVGNQNEIENIEKRLSKEIAPLERSLRNRLVNSDTISNHLKSNEAAIEFFSVTGNKLNNLDNKTWYIAFLIKGGRKIPTFISLFDQDSINLIIEKSKNNKEELFYNNLYSFDKNGNDLYRKIWSKIDEQLSDVNTIYVSSYGILNKINLGLIPIDSKMRICNKYNFHEVGTTADIVGFNNLKTSNDVVKHGVFFGGINYDKSTRDDLASTKDVEFFNLDRSAPMNLNSRQKVKWAYLPNTLSEIYSIDSLSQKNKISTELFYGANASKKEFKNAIIQSNNFILHIATHSFYNKIGYDLVNKDSVDLRESEKSLLRSGLVLSGANIQKDLQVSNNILLASEISYLNLQKVKLLVLSSCESGLGDIIGSEGVFGLQRSFKLAGVKNIVVSLWRVPDVQTKEIMISFYQYFFNGFSVSDALRMAQMEMSKKYPPYYWAAFKLLE